MDEMKNLDIVKERVNIMKDLMDTTKKRKG